MNRPLRLAGLLALLALGIEGIWLAIGLSARDFWGPFLASLVWMGAFMFAGGAWAQRADREEKEGFLYGLASYSLIGLVQYLPAVWLLNVFEWGRVSTVAPSIAMLAYAFLFWPFQWVGFIACAAGMPCGG